VLDWVVESYRVKTDAPSGLVSDPNRPQKPRFIIDLVGKFATVSLEIRKLIAQLPVLFADDLLQTNENSGALPAG
jgi:predicted helicase